MPKRATPDGAGKRMPLMARTTVDLRQALEVAAGETGRSLAQEVEKRLEESFKRDELLDAFIGEDLNSHNLMRAIAAALKINPLLTGKRWVDDYETLWHTRQTINILLEALMGLDAGRPDCPPDRSPEDHASKLRQGAVVADNVLRNLALTLPTKLKGIRDRVVAFQDQK